jgi:hypothetical protein
VLEAGTRLGKLGAPGTARSIASPTRGRCRARRGRSAGGANSRFFPLNREFRRFAPRNSILLAKNSEVNQTLADEFPQRQNREFSPT